MKRWFLAVFATALLLLWAVPICTAQSKADVIASAVEVTDDITPPQLSEVANADYTPEGKRRKIEGSVTLMIVIDKKGDVIDAKVLKGLGYGLDENAVIAVKEWKYRPAQKDGQPIAVKMQVTVDFFPRD